MEVGAPDDAHLYKTRLEVTNEPEPEEDDQNKMIIFGAIFLVIILVGFLGSFVYLIVKRNTEGVEDDEE